jgi:ABC-2 type transport system ATP-binding protein
MGEPAVRIAGLTKVYTAKKKQTVAVEDLSLDIAPGEIFGLLGPNGAGKTTTVRILCGLLAPTAGTVHVEGLSVRQEPDAVRAAIGLVPEDAGDYRNLTLDEELEYHGALYGLDATTVRARSGPLLERLGLQDRSRQRLKTYSRGMRRKFHLIRALLHRPRLLLLDEPTAGLDPSIVEEVWDLLKTLSTEQHVTVVLCSHHLEEVERLCGRVAILQKRLLISGSLAELSHSGNRYRLEVAGPAESWSPVVAASAGVAGVRADGTVLSFDVTGVVDQVVPEVVRRVVTAGGQVLALRREGRDLRSLYRSFVDNGGTVPPRAPQEEPRHV